jgi:hypothetical protein
VRLVVTVATGVSPPIMRDRAHEGTDTTMSYDSEPQILDAEGDFENTTDTLEDLQTDDSEAGRPTRFGSDNKY